MYNKKLFLTFSKLGLLSVSMVLSGISFAAEFDSEKQVRFEQFHEFTKALTQSGVSDGYIRPEQPLNIRVNHESKS